MYLLSVATELPHQAVTNADLHERFGIHQDWLTKKTGNHQRFYASHWTEDSYVSCAAMASQAALKAIEESGVEKELLTFVILATATPDHLMPSTANMVLDALDLNHIPVYQLQSGCSGAIQALDVARAMLQTRPGYGLVIGVDSCRKFWSLHSDVKKMSATELVNLTMFGDGSGAVVVSSEEKRGWRIEHIYQETTGTHQQPGQVVPWLGSNDQLLKEPLFEDYQQIGIRVPLLAQESFDRLSAIQSFSKEEVDFVLSPQLNGKISKAIADQLNIPDEKQVHCVAECGNNGNALPFFQLHALSKASTPIGSKALVITVESSRWIHGGMAMEFVGSV